MSPGERRDTRFTPAKRAPKPLIEDSLVSRELLLGKTVS
jgi:hypothetical protein